MKTTERHHQIVKSEQVNADYDVVYIRDLEFYIKIFIKCSIKSVTLLSVLLEVRSLGK